MIRSDSRSEQTVSVSPDGEVFPLPNEEDYNREWKRLQKLVKEQRLLGRGILVVISNASKKISATQNQQSEAPRASARGIFTLDMENMV